MVQETQTPSADTPVAPVEAPTPPVTEEPVTAPAEEPAPEGTEAPAEGEPIGPTSMEELIGDNDHLKSYWELRQTELKEEGRRQAQGELQPKVDRVNATFANYSKAATDASTGIQTVIGMLQEGIKSGDIDQQALARAFNAAPDAWRSMNDLTGRASKFNAFRLIAAALGGHIGGDAGAKYAGDYTTRWFQAEGGADDEAEVLTDQFKAYTEAVVEKAVTPYKNRIKSLEAQIEKAKAAGSGGPSPTAGVGTAGGSGKPYAQLSPEERRALAEEKRVDDYIARNG